jgi:hypothetical protein
LTVQNWDIDDDLKSTMTIICTTNVSQLLVELFCHATRIIAKEVDPKPIKIIFTSHQFQIIINENLWAIYIKDMIIYDVNKIETLRDCRMIIAILLEELVHVYFNISDELEASLKVVELYPEIQCDPETGRYILP